MENNGGTGCLGSVIISAQVTLFLMKIAGAIEWSWLAVFTPVILVAIVIILLIIADSAI